MLFKLMLLDIKEAKKSNDEKKNESRVKQLIIPEIRQSNLEKRFVSEEALPIESIVESEAEPEPSMSIFAPGDISEPRNAMLIVRKIRKLLHF